MLTDADQPSNPSRRNNRLKNLFLILLVFFASLSVSILTAEGILRIVHSPIDYLSPILVPDEILGYRIKPHSAHHDAWGFRNPVVPAHADIITIGDSQTYGWCADHNHSWPALLQQMTGSSVYNLSLGGYGPPQYLYLLENYAQKLSPQQIVLGFYIGNDFADSYNMTYGFDYWKLWRNPDYAPQEDLHTKVMRIVETGQPGFKRRIRLWFESHSMLLRMLNIPLQNLQTKSLKNAPISPKFTFIADDKINIHTGFKPLVRYRLSDLKTQEGMRIAFGLIDQIHDFCQKHDLSLMIAIIPTKELVFSKYLEQHPDLPNFQTLAEVASADSFLYDQTIAHCKEKGMPFCETLPALQAALGKVDIYPNNLNDHISAGGYRLIAECVQKEITSSR